jgi:hypothetical protein
MNAAFRVSMLPVVAFALIVAGFATEGTAVPVSTGLSLRYDGTNVTTISGNQVASWNNQGSAGVQGNVVPRLATARPTVLVNSLNSHDVINFAGQAQEVLRSGALSVPLAQANTLFMVLNNTGTNSPVPFDGVQGFAGRNFLQTLSNGTFHLYAGSSVFGGSGSLTNQYQVLSVRFDQANSTIHTNGSLAYSVASTIGTQSLDAVGIGNSDPNASPATLALTGQIAEVLFYDTPLNQAQRLITENYLSSKFNVGPTVSGVNRTLGVNDRYVGDLDTNGHFDRDVIGVGQINSEASTLSASAGFAIQISSGLDNGDFLLAGHKVVTNSIDEFQWSRVWFLDNRLDGNESLTLSFDWSDSGLGPVDAALVDLMFSTTENGEFTSIATGILAGDTVTFTGLTASQLLNGYYTLGVVPPAPEPSSFFLLAGGAMALASRRRRNSSKV